MKSKSIGLSVAALAFACLAAGSARADLVGDTIQAYYIYPEANSIYADLGTFTVPGGGHIYIESYGASGDQITITADPSGVNWSGADYNGIELIDITKNPNITGVSLDGSTNANGAALSDASFTSDSISFNFEGQSWGGNQEAVYDLTFAGGVPEPATWAMMLIGFLGVGIVARRRTAAV